MVGKQATRPSGLKAVKLAHRHVRWLPLRQAARQTQHLRCKSLAACHLEQLIWHCSQANSSHAGSLSERIHPPTAKLTAGRARPGGEATSASVDFIVNVAKVGDLCNAIAPQEGANAFLNQMVRSELRCATNVLRTDCVLQKSATFATQAF